MSECYESCHDNDTFLNVATAVIIRTYSVFQALIYTHDDIARKAYDEVFVDDLALVAPPPPVFDAVGEQHRFVTIRKNGKQPLVRFLVIRENISDCYNWMFNYSVLIKVNFV